MVLKGTAFIMESNRNIVYKDGPADSAVIVSGRSIGGFSIESVEKLKSYGAEFILTEKLFREKYMLLLSSDSKGIVPFVYSCNCKTEYQYENTEARVI